MIMLLQNGPHRIARSAGYCVWNECYPRGRVHSDGQRPAQPGNRLRVGDVDSLRWCLPDAPLLDTAGREGSFCARHLRRAAEPSLQCGRDAPGLVVSDGTRSGANRNDSTVLVLYGKQEGARIGYNPSKPGRRSYYPLLCFEAQTRDFWHGELRPGDVGTPRGALECVQACFAKAPRSVRRVILRADKGFFDHKLIDWVEQQGASYVIVARLTPPIQRRLSGLRYRRFGWGVETAGFHYQPHGWTHPARFVVIRRPQPEDPSEQLRLFQLGRYHYQVLVTNLPLQPLNLWRFYNDRAAVELIIKQLKGDYALGHIPTRHYLANETHFHLLLLAYNLMNWFRRLCLPPDFQTATLQTLRHKILLMPAQLRRTHNRPSLALPGSGQREIAWRHALEKIEQLKP